MTRRPCDMKVPDIKALRAVLMVLGRLEVRGCYSDMPRIGYSYDPDGNFVGQTTFTERFCGWGLKQCKDYVEGKYEYTLPASSPSPYRPIQRGNIIDEVRATRRCMSMLTKFHIYSADSGLGVCKRYVDRRRAAR